MKLINFEEVNFTFAKDQPEYDPLPCHHKKDKNGEIVCCWSLSEEEIAVIKRTGKIWHSIYSFNQPLQPQLLSVYKPFIKVVEPESKIKNSVE